MPSISLVSVSSTHGTWLSALPSVATVAQAKKGNKLCIKEQRCSSSQKLRGVRVSHPINVSLSRYGLSDPRLGKASRRLQPICAAAEGAPAPANADAAIAQGIATFKNGDLEDALSLFNLSLTMTPTTAESRAAYYNIACVQVAKSDIVGACESLKKAVKEFDLNLNVALKDPDMLALLRSPEFEKLKKDSDPLYIPGRIALVAFIGWASFALGFRLLVATGVLQDF